MIHFMNINKTEKGVKRAQRVLQKREGEKSLCCPLKGPQVMILDDPECLHQTFNCRYLTLTRRYVFEALLCFMVLAGCVSSKCYSVDFPINY